MAVETNAHSITLGRLLPVLALAPAVAAIEVCGLQSDSRAIEPGDVFVALAGNTVDGRQYFNQAVERGAVAILAESVGLHLSEDQVFAVPVIAIEELLQKLSDIACRFYGDPASEMSVVGITGTNGKTTCSQLLAQLYSLMGSSTGVIGTLGYGVISASADALQSTGFTTPDALTAQKILAEFADKKVVRVAMEVSSHSLDQGRVSAVPFKVAVFTNLSRDHLDYHGDMEAYGSAKEVLFLTPGLQQAVINVDDAWSEDLIQKLPASVQVIRYSVKDAEADVSVRDLCFSAEGIETELITPWGQGRLESKLLGEFNLSNLLAVIAVACNQGADFKSVLSLVPQLQPVAGRMETIDAEGDIKVIVDYAHTPDALAKTLQALRAHGGGNLWCVFGCGGDRDRGKRGEMGALAVQYADRVIVTSDNPRSEKPAAIIADIVADERVAKSCELVESRAEAIAQAVSQASAGDLVLLAGKGHEDYQLVGDKVLPFSDFKEARMALGKRLQGGCQ